MLVRGTGRDVMNTELFGKWKRLICGLHGEHDDWEHTSSVITMEGIRLFQTFTCGICGELETEATFTWGDIVDG